MHLVNIKLSLNTKYVWLICFTLVILTSCSTHKKTAKPNTPKEIVKLGQKLNIELDESSNIKLYRLIDEWYGTPHKDGGCSKEGTDCSCFVRMAVQEVFQKQLPRNSFEMYKYTVRADTTELKEGDLVFFTTKSKEVSHVGIFLKNQQFVHVSSSKGVIINSLNENYYRKTYFGSGKYN